MGFRSKCMKDVGCDTLRILTETIHRISEMLVGPQKRNNFFLFLLLVKKSFIIGQN